MEIVDLLPVRPQSGFFMFDHRGIDQRPKTVLIRVFDQVMFPLWLYVAQSPALIQGSSYFLGQRFCVLCF